MEEKELEIVEENIRNATLDQARKALKKDKRRIRISKICSIVVPVMVGILLIGYPIVVHNINATEKMKRWEAMMSVTEINYDDLEKEESKSLRQLNKENNGRFYWLKNAELTETYQLKQENKIILIEEHYLYNTIECVLYATNVETYIPEINTEERYNVDYLLNKNTKINYVIDESKTFGQFVYFFQYKIEIQSTDTSTIETIFSNLTTRYS